MKNGIILHTILSLFFVPAFALSVSCPPPPIASDQLVQTCDVTGKKCIAIGGYEFNSLFAYYTQGNCNWKPTNTLPKLLDYTHWSNLKCSADFSTCLAVGQTTPNTPYEINGFVAYTYDGGQTWGSTLVKQDRCISKDRSFKYSSFEDVDFIDAKGTNWVAVGSCLDPNINDALGFAMVSSDRGQSWSYSITQPIYPPSHVIKKVFCYKDSSNICLGYGIDNAKNEYTYISKDAGYNWTSYKILM